MNNGVLGCAIFAWHTGYSSFLDASASLGPGVSMIVHCWKDIAVFQDVLKRSQCLRTSLKCLYGKLFFRWPKLGKNAIAFGMISVLKGPTIFFTYLHYFIDEHHNMSYSLLLKFYSHFLGEFYQIKKLLLPKESKSRCVSPNPKICILPPPATIAMNKFIGANGIGQLGKPSKNKTQQVY